MTTALVIVDVQTRLMTAMPDGERVVANVNVLARAAEILGLPTLVTEQLPDKLGKTHADIVLPTGTEPIAKHHFSCWPNEEFQQTLRATGVERVVLCGVETHVCVLQTALDLLDNGFEVSVVYDAVTSRTPANREIALRHLELAGVSPTSVETLLFQLLHSAHNPDFKAILQLVK